MCDNFPGRNVFMGSRNSVGKYKKKVPFVQAFIEKYFQKDYKIKDM